MAAITTIALTNPRGQLLETIAITDQAAAGPTTVKKCVAVPPWAQYATVVVGSLTMAGTSPDFTFILQGVDVAGGEDVPDDGDTIPLGGWDGITAKTAAAGTTTTIDVGPNVTTDDTGSATASDHYGITAVLPAWLEYEYSTTGGGVSLEDYSGTISVYFR